MSKFTHEELIPYIDGNGLMAPCITNPETQGSDNGVMFSCEAMLIEPTDEIHRLFIEPVEKCIDKNGRLHRTPNDPRPDAPDDYYGLLALRIPALSWLLCKSPLQLIYTPNVAPYIQPQLMGMALDPILGILNPFRPLCALIIVLLALFSRAPNPGVASNVDLWRMGWLLQKGMRGALCSIARRFWFWRLHRVHPGGMRDVAYLYYQMGHPFTRVDWE